MREIDEVLRRYDLAGVVVVSDATDTAFKLSFPAWSPVQLEPSLRTPDVDRLKCKPPKDEESIGFLFKLRDGTGKQFDNLQRICALVESALTTAGIKVDG